MAKKKKVEGKPASLNPEEFIEGGGLIDDADVKIALEFAMFDYDGNADDTPCLKATIQPEDGDEMVQYYSMGRAKDWLPSEDGKQLMSVGGASGIRLSSNGGIFIKALVDAGASAEDLTEDIACLDGAKVHVVQVPLPERKGIKKTKKQQEREEKYGPPTILVVSEIHEMPGEKKKKGGGKGKGKAAANNKTRAAEDDTGDSDVIEEAAVAITSVIMEAGGEVKKKDLPKALFAYFKENESENKNEIIKMAFEDDFLGSRDEFSFDDGVLSLD